MAVSARADVSRSASAGAVGVRELGRDRSVRVSEYRCHAGKGAPSRTEEFGQPSISVVRSGVFGVRTEKRPQILTTDFLLLGNPGQPYEVSHEHSGGDCCLVFHIDETVLAEAAAGRARHPSTGRSRRYFARSVLPPLPRVAALRHLAEHRLVTGGPALEVEELAVATAAYVIAVAAEGAAPPARLPRSSRRSRDRIYRALEWLESSTGDDIRLADIARVAELSPYHFLRVFKHETGVTPYRYLVRARLRRAVRLLTTTRQPVTTIAYDVGFGDLSNFVNTFRREIGSSPTRFRSAARRGR